MKTLKLAACLALAGTLLAIYGFATRSDTTASAQSPAASVSVTSLDPITGLAPIEEVIDLFAERSEASPADYLSRTQLGQALSAQARENADLEGYEAAEVVLREALALNPQWAPAQLALARAVHSQHRFGEARDVAQKLVDTDPTSLSALALLGDAHLELGDVSAAAAVYADLAAVERSAPVVSRLARLASVNGDRSLAVELANEALMLSGDVALRPHTQAFYWFQLGRMQFEVGDVDAAIRSYGQALEIDADNGGAMESLAFAAAAVGDNERAASLYAALIETGGAPDLHGSYAEVLRQLGDADAAAEQEKLGLALAQETMDRFPAERRHLVSFLVTRDSAAAVELARADLAERHDHGAYDTLLWALYNDGQIAEAAAVLAAAPAEDPPSASMMYHRAAVLAETGEVAEALRLVSAALDLNPHFHPTEAPDAAQMLDVLSVNS